MHLGDLRRIRQSIRKKNTQIQEKLTSLLHSSSKYLQDPIITKRSDRYVIPVKAEYRSQIQGFVHDISSTGSTIFIEPLSVFEMNNEINQLKIEEAQEIQNILARTYFTFCSIHRPITRHNHTSYETGLYFCKS